MSPLGPGKRGGEPQPRIAPEMIERAARMLDRSYDRHEMTLQQVAREVLEAAFDDVPITNYGIGLALQFFDLVICVKDRPMGAAAGVYRSNGDPDGFDGLPHSITVNYGHKPNRHIKSLTIGGLPAEGQSPMPEPRGSDPLDPGKRGGVESLLRRWAAAKLNAPADEVLSVEFEHDDGWVSDSGTGWAEENIAVVTLTSKARGNPKRPRTARFSVEGGMENLPALLAEILAIGGEATDA